MSQSIPEAFVRQFDDTMRLKAQQSASRFQGTVIDRGQITGESFTVNLVGTVDELDEDNTRHGDTVWSDIDHTTPVALMKDFFKAYPVDRADEPKLLANPNGAYMDRLMMAGNLRKDKMIYDALRGTITFKDASTSVLPSTSKIAHGGTGMTKAKVIETRKLFRAAEADQHNGEELFIAYDSKMLEDILADTTLTSADYMAVKMLQEGDISGKWCGMKWIPYERMSNDGTTFYTVAWCKSAAHFGHGFEEGNATRRADKKNTLQVSRAASYGASRTENNKVVEIAYQ